MVCAAAAIFLAGTGVALSGYYLKDIGYKAAADYRDNKIKPVLDQANAWSSSWNDVVGSGANDRLTIQNVRSMLDGRGLWIDLLGEIFGTCRRCPPGIPTTLISRATPGPIAR